MRFTLPYPPSANRYWRHDRGHTHVSDEAKAYRRAAYLDALAAKVKPITSGDVAVVLDLYRPAKRGDIDNYVKVLFDALNGVAWTDDSQVQSLHIERNDDKHKPRVVVLVERVNGNAGEKEKP